MYKGLKVYNKRKAGLISQDSGGKAVKGYDLVELKTNEKLKKGRDDFSMIYNDASWLFSTKENRDLFEKNPKKYLPEYGGYCAWSVANDSELPPSPGDPAAFDIIDGKMYFKYNKLVRLIWRLSRVKYIKKGDKRWPMFVETISEYIKTQT